MTNSFNELEKIALQLSQKDRALLAQNLIASLDSDSDESFEELWAKEAEERYQDLLAGNIKTKDASSVFASSRDNLSES